jgi:threonine dehydrogenase-like Zn-dependent dehydrogenase
MKAIAIIPGTKNVQLIDLPEPRISAPDQVKLRVLRVGICGTDREEAEGGRADAPPGHKELVIGHEMFGQVVEVGKAVTAVQPGDYAVFTVRRGCGKCEPCLMNRSDMCRTGEYRERGIKGEDGYQTEFVVDSEQYVLQVPSVLKSVGVLCEPLSVVVKAIDEGKQLQMARLPDAPEMLDWPHGRRCLVSGLGPVGLLAAMVLRRHGAEVYGLDIVDENTARPQWLKAIGGTYIDDRKVPPDKLVDQYGTMHVIVECTGVPKLAFNLPDALARDGIYLLVGIPGKEREIPVPGAELLRDFVLNNQVVMGSVNAARTHFQRAIDELHDAYLQWGEQIDKLITACYPYTQAQDALSHHDPQEIKVVIEWEKAA